ncbi:MAG: cation-binding protein [Flavobacteriaceae bacterium CG_4_8_14_3_um_filter_34_10]|nr:hemerythrin domain-containing protein [Flavobacteriia bacterium]OIP51422.1 MAG: cation-binding protein [Flavobacteriaceae bacterium CG2_30_34_30]PIQ17902.1 MAG: cation-binding protein [Flavobacteriaceae bacterium CG18_big_fil_WC_8_21_14_2_50_34_36]PIV51814.1 MAG: cation-binding protein [Flavobacteriaceae bacterium CG02_land_8_20_14_3_00_34_13]PIX09629.1 MAG: cation-binding protein [Flavobacteriaceae bacterium CG_4_8_14_3_um_filter_34_10]PIZ08913.1 MAG: cation-binding protein [Flavobacteriac
MTKPIKRHIALQPWSKDHHYGLLLSWKIKKGFSLGIDPERIKKYTDWFWVNHLIPHFETEEQFVFPILGNDNSLVKQALAEHKQLKFLFEKEDAISDTLSKIETLLNNHIRFEERVLFNAIQEIANEKEVQILNKAHNGSEDFGLWDDEFWI